MRYRNRPGQVAFPPHLASFDESAWPPVPDECQGHYACRDAGYSLDCVSVEGPCGWRSYLMLEVEDPAAIPRWKRADAYERFRRARLEWLEGRGLDFSDAYWDEFTGAHRPADTMRHPPANEPRRSRW